MRANEMANINCNILTFIIWHVIYNLLLSGGSKPDFRRRGAIRAGKEVPMGDHELYCFADLVIKIVTLCVLVWKNDPRK